MIEVELSDGRIAEFPDGTLPEVMREALRRNFGPQQPNVAGDMAKSFGTGVVRGTAALAGAPGDAASWAGWLGGEGYRFGKNAAASITGLTQPATDEDVTHVSNVVRRGMPMIGFAPNAEEIRQMGTDATGITLPEAQTTPGRYAQTVGEFVPAALSGGRGLWELGRRGLPAVGTALSDLGKFALAPGIASEGAGQAFEGTAAEPYARAGAAIATGGVAALASRPSTPMAALREQAPRNMQQADITAARQLIADAQQRGVSLTWPEALAQASGGRIDMTDVQRVLEQSPGGRPVMSEFMSQRPGQVRQAMGQELDTSFGPQASPVRTGLDIQRASKASLTALRNRINVVTKPLYDAAGPVNINPARFTALSRDPLFQAAVRAVRSDPVYSRSVEGVSDMSVAMMDAIKKRLDDLAGEASGKGKNFEASVYGGLEQRVRTEGVAASPDYHQALDMQSRYRQGVLDPAEAGPTGRMAETSDLRSQTTSLFPENPTAGSERIVGSTVRRLVRQNPQAASDLVRTHLATAFDEAVQSTIAGPNQWGGAKAAATIMGNPQQERNLRAAIEALPAGQLRWRTFERLMEVMSATGKRQRPNSATEFNRQIQADMGRGGMLGTGASLAASPGSAFTYVRDWYQRFRLGQNTAALAQIITSPGSERLFARLLGAKSIGDRERLAALILYEGQAALQRPTE